MISDKDRERMAKIMGSYKEDISTANILLLGEEGSGKTYMLQTARLPLYIDSFDPGGTKTIKDFIFSSGSVVNSAWEDDKPKKAHVFKEWEKQFLQMHQDNFFANVGTYVIDSFSMFQITLMNEIASRYKRTDGVLERMDWQIISNSIRDLFLLLFALPCDVIVTGHLSSEKDEVSGKFNNKMATTPSLQSLLPRLFDEVWVLITENGSKGISRKILTCNDGRYKARTRIGSNKFNTYEDPDIMKMLIKAGLSKDHKERLI